MAHIVVADDDPDIRLITATILRRAGHEVSVCADGGELLAYIKSAAPDVVVTDNEMPVHTGLQVVVMIREDPAVAWIPVILATGSVSAADAEQTLGDGDQLLPKPFTMKQLHEAVDGALRFAGAER